MLTIAYFTSRKEPMIEWFFRSLHRETGGNYEGIRMVIVDAYAPPYKEENYAQWLIDNPNRATFLSACKIPVSQVRWVRPKPSVWQGEYRLTKEDWWAMSNARNSAVCLAEDGWILFADDLSVLCDGYWSEVREAMKKPDTISLGAYRKVLNLVVDEAGAVVSFDDHAPGHDNRYGAGKDKEGVPCGGNWLYGCSLLAPVQAFLDINGWPEAWCDPLSFEDCIAGIMLTKKGWKMEYRRSMLTLESEERHHNGSRFKRSDYGVSPNDKSHAVLHMAQAGDGWHPNYFGEEKIAGLRKRVLAGEPFPIVGIPQHEWFTGTPITEL